jgi:hypothetical protein
MRALLIQQIAEIARFHPLQITSPELERAAKLAEALALRPELVLEITGVFNRAADSEALRQARLAAEIEERIAAADVDDHYAEQRREAIEALYRERFSDQDPRAALEALREKHTSDVVDSDSGKSSEQFDELAYVAGIEQRLVDVIEIAAVEFATLAMSRAENTRIAILEFDATNTERIYVVDAYTQADTEDDWVPMNVSLGAAEAGGERQE